MCSRTLMGVLRTPSRRMSEHPINVLEHILGDNKNDPFFFFDRPWNATPSVTTVPSASVTLSNQIALSVATLLKSSPSFHPSTFFFF